MLLAAAPAAAHGGVTGTQDVLQDYGVLLFLLAVVMIGAGVLTWVLLSPQPEEDTTEPLPLGEAARSAGEGSGSPATARGPHPSPLPEGEGVSHPHLPPAGAGNPTLPEGEGARRR